MKVLLMNMELKKLLKIVAYSVGLWITGELCIMMGIRDLPSERLLGWRKKVFGVVVVGSD